MSDDARAPEDPLLTGSEHDGAADAPVPDTADLRRGVPVHEALLALLPLLGRWRGAGAGVLAGSGEEFVFGQQITVTHDGRPFLAYESRSWLLDDDGAVVRQTWRETGFWRPGADRDDVELVLAAHTGQVLMLTGVAGDQQWELATVRAEHTNTAVNEVDGERRLYAVRGDELVYASEVAPVGEPFAPHLNGRLRRLS